MPNPTPGREVLAAGKVEHAGPGVAEEGAEIITPASRWRALGPREQTEACILVGRSLVDGGTGPCLSHPPHICHLLPPFGMSLLPFLSLAVL